MDISREECGILLRELNGGESAEDDVRLRLDYCFEGRLIQFDDYEGERRSAISAVVSQGKLTQMSCCLKTFTAVEESSYFSSEWELSPNESLFNAAERVNTEIEGLLLIQDAYLYYPVSSASTQVHTVWKIETK